MDEKISKPVDDNKRIDKPEPVKTVKKLCIVRNTANRSRDIYIGGQLFVLPPFGSVEVQKEQLKNSNAAALKNIIIKDVK